MKKTDNVIRTMAKALYQEEGRIEIDDNAKISRGTEDGAYVQAWVWVEFEEPVYKAVEDK